MGRDFAIKTKLYINLEMNSVNSVTTHNDIDRGMTFLFVISEYRAVILKTENLAIIYTGNRNENPKIEVLNKIPVEYVYAAICSGMQLRTNPTNMHLRAVHTRKLNNNEIRKYILL